MTESKLPLTIPKKFVISILILYRNIALTGWNEK